MKIIYNEKELENGLKIYHLPLNKGSGVIKVNVVYKVGSRNEVMGKSGIAHMLEHLNFKATKNRKAGEFDKIVKSFGGINNASTSFDYTNYYIKCSKKDLETCLDLYSDIMENLLLDEEEFLTERAVVLEERLWRTDNNPFGYMFFRLYNNAFLYHPYHWTPIGFKKDIENWKIEDIRAFHEEFYQPQNAFLVISGDIEKEEVFTLAEKYFKHIKNKKDLKEFYFEEPKQDGAKEILIDKKNQTDILMLAYKIPSFTHEDQINIEALGEYLAGGKSSLLERIFVDERELVNSIGVTSLASKDENLLIIFALCNQDVDAKFVKEEILKVLEEVKESQLPEEELEKIKNNAKAGFIYAFDSIDKLSNVFTKHAFMSTLDKLDNYEENIEKLSSEGLIQAAKTYLNIKNSTTLLLERFKS